MPGKTNTSKATTICKNFDMSEVNLWTSSRLAMWRFKCSRATCRVHSNLAGDSLPLARHLGERSHIPNVRMMKLLLAVVNWLVNTRLRATGEQCAGNLTAAVFGRGNGRCFIVKDSRGAAHRELIHLSETNSFVILLL